MAGFALADLCVRTVSSAAMWTRTAVQVTQLPIAPPCDRGIAVDEGPLGVGRIARGLWPMATGDTTVRGGERGAKPFPEPKGRPYIELLQKALDSAWFQVDQHLVAIALLAYQPVFQVVRILPRMRARHAFAYHSSTTLPVNRITLAKASDSDSAANHRPAPGARALPNRVLPASACRRHITGAHSDVRSPGSRTAADSPL